MAQDQPAAHCGGWIRFVRIQSLLIYRSSSVWIAKRLWFWSPNWFDLDLGIWWRSWSNGIPAGVQKLWGWTRCPRWVFPIWDSVMYNRDWLRISVLCFKGRRNEDCSVVDFELIDQDARVNTSFCGAKLKIMYSFLVFIATHLTQVIKTTCLPPNVT